MTYKINKNANLTLTSGTGTAFEVDIKMIENALVDVQDTIKKITDYIPVNIFEILGMRNLSAFIGELFAKSLIKESNGLFKGNPHQDGYPDLLLMDITGLGIINRLQALGSLRDKAPFSPFQNGGIEIKATCGAVPTPLACTKKGIIKPNIGDARVDILTGYDWKAHHRETNNLMGILWDFENGIPKIMAVFLGGNLTETDWSKIVQPIEGGGRTTSVSIMTRDGVKKMYTNWIAVENDNKYINFLNKYNKDNKISLVT